MSNIANLKNDYSTSYFQKGLQMLIVRNFIDYSHFQVVSLKHKYRARWVKDIYEMNKGSAPEICEIYFDDEWLCDISAKHKPNEALALIQFHLLDRLKTGKIARAYIPKHRK